MQHAKFYGTAPISLESKIMVRSGAFDRAGTLLISEMQCLNTGIIWRGTLTPPGWRGIEPPPAVGFPKFYLVEDVQIDCVTPETVFSLVEIPAPGTT